MTVGGREAIQDFHWELTTTGFPSGLTEPTAAESARLNSFDMWGGQFGGMGPMGGQ